MARKVNLLALQHLLSLGSGEPIFEDQELVSEMVFGCLGATKVWGEDPERCKEFLGTILEECEATADEIVGLDGDGTKWTPLLKACEIGNDLMFNFELHIIFLIESCYFDPLNLIRDRSCCVVSPPERLFTLSNR